jgi:hypothetical protein
MIPSFTRQRKLPGDFCSANSGLYIALGRSDANESLFGWVTRNPTRLDQGNNKKGIIWYSGTPAAKRTTSLGM